MLATETIGLFSERDPSALNNFTQIKIVRRTKVPFVGKRLLAQSARLMRRKNELCFMMCGAGEKIGRVDKYKITG